MGAPHTQKKKLRGSDSSTQDILWGFFHTLGFFFFFGLLKFHKLRMGQQSIVSKLSVDDKYPKGTSPNQIVCLQMLASNGPLGFESNVKVRRPEFNHAHPLP